MATEYTEEQLIQMIQDGEISWREYINMQPDRTRDEYELYCFRNNLDVDDENAAISYMEMKEYEFDLAVDNEGWDEWL